MLHLLHDRWTHAAGYHCALRSHSTICMAVGRSSGSLRVHSRNSRAAMGGHTAGSCSVLELPSEEPLSCSNKRAMRRQGTRFPIQATSRLTSRNPTAELLDHSLGGAFDQAAYEHGRQLAAAACQKRPAELQQQAGSTFLKVLHFVEAVAAWPAEPVHHSSETRASSTVYRSSLLSMSGPLTSWHA